MLTAAAAGQAPAPQTDTASPRQAATSPARSPRNANYSITARLDPGSRTLKGEELIGWRNTTANAAASLRLHLYYNAWRNTRSSWIREEILAGDTDIAKRPPEDWGWIDITGMRLMGAGWLMASFTR